jgi:hypothetical protein
VFFVSSPYFYICLLGLFCFTDEDARYDFLDEATELGLVDVCQLCTGETAKQKQIREEIRLQEEKKQAEKAKEREKQRELAQQRKKQKETSMDGMVVSDKLKTQAFKTIEKLNCKLQSELDPSERQKIKQKIIKTQQLLSVNN